MLTKDSAKIKVAAMLASIVADLPADDEIIIVDNATIERDWGWVFFYTSQKYYETHEIKYALAGNAPVFVEKSTGRLLSTGTAQTVEHYINNFERTGNPHD